MFVAKVFGAKGFLFLCLTAGWLANDAQAADYYVAKDGHNRNPGTADQPWLTIQKAADSLRAGDTVYVKSGVYHERVTINVQGNAQEGYITFRAFGAESVTLDGAGFNLSKPWGGLMQAFGKSYFRIQGFRFRNTRGGGSIVVCGDRGAGYIEILDNEVSAHTGGNAIGIRGSNLSHITVDNNDVHHCDTGTQEAIRIDKGTSYFAITNNRVHDNTNIGIDCVGWGVQPAYGIISHNTCYRNGLPGSGAHAIYIDGGTYITVENNICYDNAGGISVGAEYEREIAHHIIVRKNIIYNGWTKGITLGGSSLKNGRAESCAIVHNTLYNNQNGKWPRELKVNHFRGTNVVKNNIIYNTNVKTAGLIENRTSANPENIRIDYNCYFPANAWFAYKSGVHNALAAWRTATSQDQHSITQDPVFMNAPAYDFRLQASSPCRDAGDFLTRTIGPGSGMIIPVADARTFCDGYGGWFPGDLIQVGQNRARITQVNTTAHTLSVDQALVWIANDGVSLPFSGSRPDMGAYEFGAEETAAPAFRMRTATPNFSVKPEPPRP